MHQTFTRPLVEEDWVRFQYYAERVRVFGSCRFKTPGPGVSESALLDLSLYRPVKILLPNLHSLLIKPDNMDTIRFSQAFLGANLHSIDINGCSIDKQAINSLFIYILRLSPNIKKIKMDARGPAPTSFYRLIHTAKSLTHIAFSTKSVSLETAGIEHLSQHPNLKQLTCVRVMESLVPHFTTASGRFPSLQEFDFTVCNWFSATTIMRQMQCRFTDLSIMSEYQGNEPLSLIMELTSCISEHLSISSLTNLSLTSSNGPVLPHDADGATILGLFAPLFNCTALRELHLTFSAVAKFNDTWLVRASFAWPLLKSLKVKNVYPQPSEMTLAGLIPLVRRCPDLCALSIGIRASPVNPHLLNGVHNLKLKELSLGPSTIESPGQVARSLVRLFPSLELVESDPTLRVRAKRWMSVNKILRTMI